MEGGSGDGLMVVACIAQGARRGVMENEQRKGDDDMAVWVSKN